jgi:adenosylcobyric acid synthase
MLGKRITNASIEGTGEIDVVDGLGLLPVEIRFSHQKRVQQVSLEITGSGPIGVRERVQRLVKQFVLVSWALCCTSEWG